MNRSLCYAEAQPAKVTCYPQGVGAQVKAMWLSHALNKNYSIITVLTYVEK